MIQTSTSFLIFSQFIIFYNKKIFVFRAKKDIFYLFTHLNESSRLKVNSISILFLVKPSVTLNLVLAFQTCLSNLVLLIPLLLQAAFICLSSYTFPLLLFTFFIAFSNFDVWLWGVCSESPSTISWVAKPMSDKNVHFDIIDCLALLLVFCCSRILYWFQQIYPLLSLYHLHIFHLVLAWVWAIDPILICLIHLVYMKLLQDPVASNSKHLQLIPIEPALIVCSVVPV